MFELVDNIPQSAVIKVIGVGARIEKPVKDIGRASGRDRVSLDV